MKVFGWICTIVGALSFGGAVLYGDSVFGPTFLLALGLFLLYKVRERKEK